MKPNRCNALCKGRGASLSLAHISEKKHIGPEPLPPHPPAPCQEEKHSVGSAKLREAPSGTPPQSYRSGASRDLLVGYWGQLLRGWRGPGNAVVVHGRKLSIGLVWLEAGAGPKVLASSVQRETAGLRGKRCNMLSYTPQLALAHPESSGGPDGTLATAATHGPRGHPGALHPRRMPRRARHAAIPARRARAGTCVARGGSGRGWVRGCSAESYRVSLAWPDGSPRRGRPLGRETTEAGGGCVGVGLRRVP